jgi:hypothetical protein
MKFVFADLPGISYFAKSECPAALDLDQDAWRQSRGDEQAKPILRNVNNLDRPTVRQRRRQGTQGHGIRNIKARLGSPICTLVVTL